MITCIRICMSTVSEKYYDTASGGKGKMKKAEKITIKVIESSGENCPE